MKESFVGGLHEKARVQPLENIRNLFKKATEIVRSIAEKTGSVSEDIRDSAAERLSTFSHLTEYATLVASRISARKEFLTREQQEKVRDNCKSLESQLGIEGEGERTAETALLIDPPFLKVAVLRGDMHPEESFGIRAWEGWLEARNEIKGMDQLTLDDVIKLQGLLTKGMPQDTQGVLRDTNVAGSDTTDLGKPLSLNDQELKAIEDNPVLRFMKRGEEPGRGYILYPTVKDPQLFEACKKTLSPEANARLDAGPTDQMLVMELLDARLSELRAEEPPKSRDEVIARAAKLQRDIVSIHPFVDTNGRLSRLMMNWYLEKHGVSPSVLEYGEADLFFSQEEWADEVKRGVEQHDALQKKPLWNTSQKSFFRQVYGPEKLGALPDPKKMRHKPYREFLVDFEDECQKFIEATTAKIDSPDFKGEMLETGGIVREEYIDKFGDTRPEVQEEVRSRFYHNDRFVYRGLPMNGVSDARAALNLFTQINASAASYRADLYGETSTNDFVPISREAVQRTLRDYNQAVVVDYVRKFGDTPNMESVSPALKKFREQEASLWGRMSLAQEKKDKIESAFNRNEYASFLLARHQEGGHGGRSSSDILLSPMVSTSVGYHEARVFKRGDVGELGVVIKSFMPRDGIYYSPDVTSVPLVNTETWKNAPHFDNEREVMVPGAIDPSAISMVEVLGLSGALVATISRIPGNQVEFVDFEKKVREIYEFQTDGTLNLVSTQELDRPTEYLQKALRAMDTGSA